MSYYYDDTPHPIYDDNPPYNPTYYANTPHYYHHTSAHLVDTSQYSFSEPANYNHARELEAYAEAASNRIYSWDEIHPAYRDHLTDNYCEPIQPPVDDEYYDDVTDEELAEINRRCMEYQKQMAEKDVVDVEGDTMENCADREEDVGKTGTVEVVRGEDREEDDGEELKDEGDGEDADCPLPLQLPSLPQSLPPPDHISCNNTSATPPPDIRAPTPHLPSPNICDVPAHLHQHHRQNHHPPDIVAPPPLPLKPNISHQHSFQMFEDEHCLEVGRCV